uniref:Thaumatin-like protein n=1 Tax=Aegilops tauschii TaxID=37682 RepID=M8CBJ1_AEGTA
MARSPAQVALRLIALLLLLPAAWSATFTMTNNCGYTFFKSACPRAYSYAYDDSTSTFTCAAGTNYAITFCPSTTSGKYTDENPQAAGVPPANGTMVYRGGEQFSTSGGASTAAHASQLLLAAAVAVALLL